MSDREELLACALDSLPDGMALLDGEGGLVFWNRAAEAITGYRSADLLARAIPEALQPLLLVPHAGERSPAADRGILVRVRHKLGHDLPVMTRMLVLRDELGERLGLAALFHPAARLDALPHGESGDDPDVEASQTELEERLELEFEDFASGGQALGVLWIAVDQGEELRRTHGVAASQAMVDRVRRALTAGLRPIEELGRWGDDEFLVIAHERTPEMLASHARTLAGLARTTDFRWWGDRISLTASIGAAQAEPGESLLQLLGRARRAMEASLREGGNRVTFAPPRSEDQTEPGEDLGGRP